MSLLALEIVKVIYLEKWGSLIQDISNIEMADLFAVQQNMFMRLICRFIQFGYVMERYLKLM
ncbi:hypothetical protein HMPREF0023_2866 [Acinetobacter sp. ATCC 27244]|nr:hypothetical protein HMPREF0023_2866 [Acinetobacter sp. ATCC 27244]